MGDSTALPRWRGGRGDHFLSSPDRPLVAINVVTQYHLPKIIYTHLFELSVNSDIINLVEQYRARCCSANATPKSTRRDTIASGRGGARLHTINNEQVNFDTENESEQPTKPIL